MGFGRTASPACHTENRFECMELESEWFGGKAWRFSWDFARHSAWTDAECSELDFKIFNHRVVQIETVRHTESNYSMCCMVSYCSDCSWVATECLERLSEQSILLFFCLTVSQVRWDRIRQKLWGPNFSDSKYFKIDLTDFWGLALPSPLAPLHPCRRPWGVLSFTARLPIVGRCWKKACFSLLKVEACDFLSDSFFELVCFFAWFSSSCQWSWRLMW